MTHLQIRCTNHLSLQFKATPFNICHSHLNLSQMLHLTYIADPMQPCIIDDLKAVYSHVYETNGTSERFVSGMSAWIAKYQSHVSPAAVHAASVQQAKVCWLFAHKPFLHMLWSAPCGKPIVSANRSPAAEAARYRLPISFS